MVTKKIWKSLVPTLHFCPRRILHYNSKLRILQWNEKSLPYYFAFYFITGSINVFLFLLFLLYKILTFPMSEARLTIHVLMMCIAGFSWLLGLLCTYTVIGNSTNCCVLFNCASLFYNNFFGKSKGCIVQIALIVEAG